MAHLAVTPTFLPFSNEAIDAWYARLSQMRLAGMRVLTKDVPLRKY